MSGQFNDHIMTSEFTGLNQNQNKHLLDWDTCKNTWSVQMFVLCRLQQLQQSQDYFYYFLIHNSNSNSFHSSLLLISSLDWVTLVVVHR